MVIDIINKYRIHSLFAGVTSLLINLQTWNTNYSVTKINKTNNYNYSVTKLSHQYSNTNAFLEQKIWFHPKWLELMKWGEMSHFSSRSECGNRSEASQFNHAEK